MIRSPEHSMSKGETKKVDGVVRGPSFLEQSYEASLVSDSYEEALAALGQIDNFIEIRKQLNALRVPTFYQVFEDLYSIQNSSLSASEKDAKISKAIREAEGRCNVFSPRVADMYLAVISDLKNEDYQPRFAENAEKMLELKQDGVLSILAAQDIPWSVKLNRIVTRVDGYLAGRRAFDKREGKIMDDDTRKIRQEKINQDPVNPPSRRKESKPSMDEMERSKEGEKPPALWSIYPAYGGYFREQSLSAWDADRNVWTEPNYTYSKVELVPKLEKEDGKNGRFNFTARAQIKPNSWIGIPSPYTHGVSSIECSAPYHLQQDQNGDVLIMIEGSQVVEVGIVFSPVPFKSHGPRDRSQVKLATMPANFGTETSKQIDKIRSTINNKLDQAHALAAHTRRHLTYSNDSSFNNIYDTDPNGYFAAIDKHQQADCDVANTYFAALCNKLQIPVRHVVGHSVKGTDNKGNSNINSGTGHAWSEVWDSTNARWIRIDATPPGDPNMEEEDEEKNKQTPGDYGENEQEQTTITDEQLEELRKKLAERKDKLSYTKEERYLAETTGVELQEARQIVREIEKAEDTRLPNGKRVVDVMSRLFNAIVESRKTSVEAYDGPVRKSEGGEAIEDIIRHKIGIVAGDADPVSREKPTTEEQNKSIIGGFDVYVIGDKSGSMGYRSQGNETLLQIQRRAEYLIFSALHRFEQALTRAGIPSKEYLSVRSQGISFRGNGEQDIDLDKPLSGKFEPKDKVRLWHSLSNQGYGNGDVAALNYIYGQILTEEEKRKKEDKTDKRLRLVIACSDGGPDDPVKVKQYAEELGKLGTIVVGIGLTESARAVPEIYNTPHSRGDIAKDINDLPIIVAKHIINEAIRLFPTQAQAGAKALIESTLAEFKKF